MFSNQIGDAGCLTAVVTGQMVRFYAADITPGWSYTVSNTSTGIRVTFTNAKQGIDARIDPERPSSADRRAEMAAMGNVRHRCVTGQRAARTR